MPAKHIKRLFISAVVLLLLSFKQSNMVYVCLSPGATKYHNHYCQGLKNCKHKVEQITRADAIKRGYGACGYCYR